MNKTREKYTICESRLSGDIIVLLSKPGDAAFANTCHRLHTRNRQWCSGVMTEKSKDEARWIRHQAIQIVAQLPDDTGQALAVLTQARRLVIGFMDGGKITEPHEITALRP